MSEQLGVGAPQQKESSDDTSPDDHSASDEHAGSVDTAADRTEADNSDVDRDGSSHSTGVATTSSGSAQLRREAGYGSVISTDSAAGNDTGSASSTDPTDPGRANGAGRSPLDAARSVLASRSTGPIRARRVARVVRQIDPWSVLKLSLLFYFCTWAMVMVAMVLLWGVAVGSGAVESLENALAEILAFEELRFNGDQLFQILALGGLIGVFVATAVTAVLSLLFNFIAALTGGIRMTVIEEESARRIVRQR